MADGTVRGTCGTAVDAGTNRTWTAENMRRTSAAPRALARWQTESTCEGEAEVEAEAEILLGGGIAHAQTIFATTSREVFRIISSGKTRAVSLTKCICIAYISRALQTRKFLSICP